MGRKFTFLLLFCLISLKLDAAISYIQTEFAVHFFLEDKGPALLTIPLEGQDFIQIAAVYYEIDEKLGSYKVGKSYLRKSTNFRITKVTHSSLDEINIGFEVKYQKQLVQGVILVQGKFSKNQAKQTITLSAQLSTVLNYNSINYQIPKEYEAIFGGGIQFSHCNLKGQTFPLIVEENGIGRGDKGPTFWANLVGAAGNEHTTYAPLPNFVTDDGIHYDCKAIHPEYFWEVDFTSNHCLNFQFNNLSPTISSENSSISISYKIETSPEDQVLMKNIPEYPNLDTWMYQYVLGIQGGKTKVDNTIKKLQDQGIQIGAIWIQDWVGKRQTVIGSRLQWDWRANEYVYPNLKEWIDSLHQEDIRVLGYINPYFVEGGQQADFGLANDYFVKTDKEEAYKLKAGGFNAYMIDLNNNDANKWMKSIIKNNLIQNGFDGWMCDFGEWFPLRGFSRKNSPRITHNNFAAAWVNLNQSLNTTQNLFIFNRSWYGSNSYFPPIMWLGDQMGNFGKSDGLGSAVNAYNSASLSGFPLVHSDIGGYTAINLGPVKNLRDDEVLQRWIEMECFTPLWRSHEGLLPEDMSQIYQDEEMLTFFAYFDSIHNSLIPYFQGINQAITRTGESFVRHPFLLYPDDENTYDIQYQFFVGNDLLVCPVIEQGANSVKAYLPEGKWKHFFTNELFLGGCWHEFDAPIGKPVAFWKVD
jgi:alpha-glucosidase